MIDIRVVDGVEFRIKILDSALKHGVTKETLFFVLENQLFDEMVDGDPAKTLIIGYDENANLVEMIFYEMEEDYLVVFHAMPCRKVYMEKLFRQR
jgi:hypothetical protein